MRGVRCIIIIHSFKVIVVFLVGVFSECKNKMKSFIYFLIKYRNSHRKTKRKKNTTTTTTNTKTYVNSFN
jgi:hypothetical protein